MEVRDFWRKVAHRNTCRIYIANRKSFSVGRDLSLDIERRDVLEVPEDEQPIFVIDNTRDGNQQKHATMESNLHATEEGAKSLKIAFSTSLIGKGSGRIIDSSNVLVKFFSDNKQLVGQEKIVEKISYLKIHHSENEIPIPEGVAFFSIALFVNSENCISIAYSGFHIGDSLRVESEDERPVVTMFVFNNFSNDTRVLREAKSLLEVGFRVRVMAVLSSNQAMNEEIEGVEVIRLQLNPIHLKILKKRTSNTIFDRSIRKLVNLFFMPFHRYLMFLEFEKRAISFLAGDPSEIYHAHDLNTLRTAKKMSAMHDAKLVYDSHELYLDRNRPRKAGFVKRLGIRKFEKGLIRKCDSIITVNESIAGVLEKRYGLDGVNVVMNTPPMQFFREGEESCDLRKILKIDEEMKIAIYVGSIQYNRGIENLLKSIQYIDDVHLVLMGYGDSGLLQELDEIANNLSLDDRFSIFGPVPSELVPQYTSSADIGVAPILNSCLSYYLCSPNKVFEYMHAGIPVISSDFPELRKVVVGEDIGRVFNPEDPEEIARSIKEISGNEELLRKYRRNSIASSRKYNWGSQSRKLQEIYSEVFPGIATAETVGESRRVSPIEEQLLGKRCRGVSWVDVENSIPGDSGWGSPRGRETSKEFRIILNSMSFKEGESIEISAISRSGGEFSGSIYRIGHYGGMGGRKICEIGKNELAAKKNSFEEENSENWEIIFSKQIDSAFLPGVYVAKVENEKYNSIAPFCIYGEGEVLAVIPTVSNRISCFSSHSDEHKAIFTHGPDPDFTIRGNARYPFQNGRGGKIPEWVFPFCRWSERNSIAVSWTTDVEIESNPEISEDCQKILLLGNSRYWTRKMHEMISRHISFGGDVANIGCGMGEQMISLESDGYFEVIDTQPPERESLALCENWARPGSPTKFGGRTETGMTMSVEGLGDEEFRVFGSWDSSSNVNADYRVDKILSLQEKLANSESIKISSLEIRGDSGSNVFLASMENWTKFLDEGAGVGSQVSAKQRKYLSGLLGNNQDYEKNDLQRKRDSIVALAEKEWGATRSSVITRIFGRKELIPVEKVCILSSIWKRDSLTSVFLSHLAKLKERISSIEIECLIVGSEGEKTKRMVEKFGHTYLESENYPLSKKWDSGLKRSRLLEPDAVVILGSDDFISQETLLGLIQSISEGRLMTGLMDMHILDSRGNRLYHWNGYVSSNSNRRWETIGLARCLSRHLLERVDFSLWGDEEINRGLDGLMTRRLSKIGLIPIPHGEEVWMNVNGEDLAFGHSGVYNSEIGGFAVDVKSGENITPVERYDLSNFDKIEDYKKIIEESLGEDTLESISTIGD